MKKMLCLLLLAAAGCYYPAHTVRRAYPADPPLSREEVERLSNAGVSEAVTIEMIGKRGAAPLTPDDLVALKNAGTPDAVVQQMIASERKSPQAAVAEESAYPASYYYYDYPHFYSSFSYGYGWGWGYSYYYPRGYMGVRIYR